MMLAMWKCEPSQRIQSVELLKEFDFLKTTDGYYPNEMVKSDHENLV